MNREDIIRMEQEAGVTFVTDFGVASATPEWLERFAALVAAAEREACAKVCEEYWEIDGTQTAKEFAVVIREMEKK